VTACAGVPYVKELSTCNYDEINRIRVAADQCGYIVKRTLRSAYCGSLQGANADRRGMSGSAEEDQSICSGKELIGPHLTSAKAQLYLCEL